MRDANPEDHIGDHFAQVEGFSDAIKAQMRSLAHTLDALDVRLDEVRSTPVPSISASIEGKVPSTPTAKRPRTPKTPKTPAVGGPASRPGTADGLVEVDSSDESTVGFLVRMTGALLDGMREELQVMREIEFEVVVGEKAWLEGQMRSLSLE